MSRFIDSFLKLYNIYYKNLYNNFYDFYRIKITQNQTILIKYFHDISASDNDYIYDNLSCSLYYKLIIMLNYQYINIMLKYLYI